MRTPEQVIADEALTAAIDTCWRAYYENTTGVLTEYIVVAARQLWADDGEPLTATASLHRDGDVPLHRLLGLTEYASARLRKRIAED